MLPKFEKPKDRLVFAMDPKNPLVPLTAEEISGYVDVLGGRVGTIKINSVYYGENRDFAVRKISNSGSSLWIDCKNSDIPETVLTECIEMVELVNSMNGILRFITLHITGTGDMIEYVVNGLQKKYGDDRPLILGITVLTTTSTDALRDELKVNMPLGDYVVHLAGVGKNAGADGVVSSAIETPAIYKKFGDTLLRVTPAIRLAGGDPRKQKRIVTPREAMEEKFSDMVVMGTSLKTNSEANVQRALREIEEGLAARK